MADPALRLDPWEAEWSESLPFSLVSDVTKIALLMMASAQHKG
jgi:hypothetical protein